MTDQPEFILGSRGSRLALFQAERVQALLRSRWPRLGVTIRKIVTEGDRVTGKPLVEFSGVGIFVKELERALQDMTVHAAVHSLKDLPTELPSGLRLAAIPVREEYRDALITASGRPLAQLPSGAKIATGSPRRGAQLLALRPDLRILPIRGNVETRIAKMRSEGLDGIVLSHAGLGRLGFADQVTEVFDPSAVVPAAGQGAIAVEARADDPESLRILQGIHQPEVGHAIEAERMLLLRLGGGCKVPIGALALPVSDGRLRLIAAVCSLDGRRLIRAESVGAIDHPEEVAARVEQDLLAQGAREILASS